MCLRYFTGFRYLNLSSDNMLPIVPAIPGAGQAPGPGVQLMNLDRRNQPDQPPAIPLPNPNHHPEERAQANRRAYEQQHREQLVRTTEAVDRQVLVLQSYQQRLRREADNQFRQGERAQTVRELIAMETAAHDNRNLATARINNRGDGGFDA